MDKDSNAPQPERIELGVASEVTQGAGGVYPEGASMWVNHGISDD